MCLSKSKLDSAGNFRLLVIKKRNLLEFVVRAKFILTTRLIKNDITDEGYDFNGWILEFFQDNCNGLVQIDGQGFFSPKGELVVDMQDDPEEDFTKPQIQPS